jgi:signal peptidase I
MNTLRRARRSTMVETVFLLVVAIGLAVALQAYAIKPYKIPSGSMEPTLHVGDRVLVNRFAQRVLGHHPKIDDVVVFHPPQGADDASAPVCGNTSQGQGTSAPCGKPTPARSSQSFIKRVVGLGGDRIALKDGHVIRNGKPTEEPFVARCDPSVSACDFPNAITIPQGSVYLLGDNRGNSDDSRFWGPIPEDWVVGRAMATYWPPGRISGGK